MNIAIIGQGLTKGRSRRELFALACLPVAGLLLALPWRYFGNSNVFIGLALFPFCLFFSGRGRLNVLYGLVFLVFLILSCVYPLKIFYFIAAIFFLLTVLELYIGRINPLILFLAGTMLPIFHQVATIMGFPIRLLLSEWAGMLLQLVHFDVTVQGNTMIRDGMTFTVDEACMGLNMVSFSMLMALAVISHHYRATGLRLSFGKLAIFFLSVITLIIIANLLRIIILVVFGIAPGNPLHEITGLACVVVYIIVPLYFIAAWMCRTMGVAMTPATEPTRLPSRLVLSLAWFGGIALLIAGISHPSLRDHDHSRPQEVSIPHFSPEQLEDGITKFSNDDILVYVKPIPDFYSGEHTPLICWKGSGYEITRVMKRVVSGVPVYTGILSKDGVDLHTAWWYFDGHTRTIEQVEWRSLMLRGGDGFSLVNVTARDEATLLGHLEWILRDDGLVLRPGR